MRRFQNIFLLHENFTEAMIRFSIFITKLKLAHDFFQVLTFSSDTASIKFNPLNELKLGNGLKKFQEPRSHITWGRVNYSLLLPEIDHL